MLALDTETPMQQMIEQGFDAEDEKALWTTEEVVQRLITPNSHKPTYQGD
ncbi:MAG: hypothetical protein ABFS45_26710 [Pseudomonadota bacterium]